MKNYQFRRKIILMNILLIFGLILILSFFAYFYLVHISNNNFRERLEVETSGIATQIESIIEMADEIALQLSANNYIINTFQNIPKTINSQNYFILNPSIDASVKKFMLSYMLKKNSIGRVCLFDNNNNFIFVGRAVDYGYIEKNCLDYSFMEHIQSYFKENNNVTLFDVYQQDPFSIEEGVVLTVTREINDYLIVPSEPVGYVQVQIPIRFCNKIFNKMISSMQGYIVNSKTQKIIYSYSESESDINSDQNMYNNFINTKKDMYIRNNVYVKVKDLEQYKLKIIILERNDILIKYAVTTLIWMLLLMAGIVLLVIIGQVKIIKTTTKPIVELCELVESIKIDENLLGIPTIISKEDDELRQLNYAFSELMMNLKLFMDKNMTSQINELKSHMYALQSQMNPHFIHNVLTIISVMATEDEYIHIPNICEKLSEMIRYSTTFDDSLISIGNEMVYTVNYLELMKLRYEEKFNYNINYLNNDLELKVPKFIFQPLVENCFKHGFKNKDFPWQLEILLMVENNMWQIQIQDNGKGLTKDHLKVLINEIDKIKRKSIHEIVKQLKIGGLSIVNICARIYMAYGDNMIFEIESEENLGFVIRLGGKIQ